MLLFLSQSEGAWTVCTQKRNECSNKLSFPTWDLGSLWQYQRFEHNHAEYTWRFSSMWKLPIQGTLSGISLVVQWLRLCFHCRGRRFDPWSGNYDLASHMVQQTHTHTHTHTQRTPSYFHLNPAPLSNTKGTGFRWFHQWESSNLFINCL